MRENKFDSAQKYSKFLLEIMTLVLSTNIIASGTEFITRGSSFIYILWTIEAIELIFGELCNTNQKFIYLHQTCVWTCE
jgi:hypothetical protein